MGLIVSYCQGEKDSCFSRLFLTFDEEPLMYRLPPIFGTDACKLADVITSMHYKPSGLSTNFSGCMDLMLAEMVRRRTEEEDNHATKKQPMFIVFTDMQFDAADSTGGEYESNLDVMEDRFAEADIPMPIIVFWNVRGCGSAAKAAAQPSRKNVVMLSGFSTNLMEDFFNMLSEGKFLDQTVVMDSEDEDGLEEDGEGNKKKELNTDSVIKLLLDSDMYRRYRMPHC
jgi:hypothetical protein